MPRVTRLAFFTALVLSTALPALAQAQGYSGLFAPAPDEQAAPAQAAPVQNTPTQTTPAQATPARPAPKSEKPAAAAAPAETYSGLIPAAPASKSPAKKAATTAPAADPVYSGLIAPDTGATKTTKSAKGVAKVPRPTSAAVPQMTPIPRPAASRPTRDVYINGPKPVMNSQDLRTAALFNSLNHDSFDVRKRALSPDVQAAIAKKVAAASGSKSSTERRVDKTVQKMMKEVNDPRISPDERKRRAAAAYDKLLKDSDGILALGKATTPIYTQYGVPEPLVKQRQDGRDRALTTLQGAIRQLDTMRK